MSLEILCVFLFKSSEAFFEEPEKLFLMVNQQIFISPISLFSNMLKIVQIGHFVEQTILYKV